MEAFARRLRTVTISESLSNFLRQHSWWNLLLLGVFLLDFGKTFWCRKFPTAAPESSTSDKTVRVKKVF